MYLAVSCLFLNSFNIYFEVIGNFARIPSCVVFKFIGKNIPLSARKSVLVPGPKVVGAVFNLTLVVELIGLISCSNLIINRVAVWIPVIF